VARALSPSCRDKKLIQSILSKRYALSEEAKAGLSSRWSSREKINQTFQNYFGLLDRALNKELGVNRFSIFDKISEIKNEPLDSFFCFRLMTF